MALTGTRTFVGFGFGAIQSGLFLYEAFQSGNFRRLVVAEVVPDVVTAVRQAGNFYAVNIAHHDHVESAYIGPVEILDPAIEADRRQIIAAIAEAEEIATAIPSVAFYTADTPGSIHRLLAEGLCRKVEHGGPRAVVYAAENHNHAAEILEEQVLSLVPPEQQRDFHAQVSFLNSVIGKMSQVVADPVEIQRRGLEPIVPGFPRAFLVESFNRILISRIKSPAPFERGITVLQEKDDLLPFEEAKLFGHNATHALMGYLGRLLGAQRVADLRIVPGVVPFARAAFIKESGEALVRKYHGIDPLFTPEGYREYADDLLERMMNPFLVDSIERVTRDTERKLGWNDRLVGTIRLAQRQGLKAYRYAFGTAAALMALEPPILEAECLQRRLHALWQDSKPEAGELASVLSLIGIAWQRLEDWRAEGFPDLEYFSAGWL